VVSSEQLAPAAFVSTWLQLRCRIEQLVSTCGKPASLTKQDAQAARAVLLLRHQGAAVTDTLQVQFEPTARAQYVGSPFSLDITADSLPQNSYDFNALETHGKGLLSRVSRVVAAVQAVRLHAAITDERRKIALLSASGELVGQFSTAAPTSRREAFENLWFRTSLRQRLHLSITSSGQLCQLRKAERGDERCLQELNEKHVYCCQTGLARFRPHTNLIHTLSDALRNLGAHVDVERYCPELLRHKSNGEPQEAWLDVCAQFPGHVQL
jgi:hypothetical protein